MPYWEHVLLEGIKFAAFVFVCGCLMRFRFRSRVTGLAAAGALLAILALQAGLLLAGLDATLVLTLLPVTAYLPAILAVHLLSGSGFLPTASVWSAGVLLSFTLLFLQRLVNLWLPTTPWGRCWRRRPSCAPWPSAFSAAPIGPMCWKIGAAGCC